ncbi:MAG: glycine/betaine ABC transporter substrate-binding protein [Peptococcaceae bacterium]|nr:glycine/betaine ABC transporter substrate-binding protein [Peptococcaceae bacterium]
MGEIKNVRGGKSPRGAKKLGGGKGLILNRLNRALALLLAAVLSLSLAACGGGGGGDEAVIVIYDGQYSEMKLIHYMVKLLVEEHTDAKVEIREEMAPVNSYNEVVKGTADLMNSYDGTLLTTFLHLDPADVPAGVSLYDFVNSEAAKAEEKGRVRLLDKLGINNTYAIAVPQQIADQYQLNTVSDLIPVADQLVFGAEHDFFTEEGSAKYNPLVRFYGLNFKDARQIDISLKYTAVESGNIDVTCAYSTDGLNKKYQLKILTDDRAFFPEYNGALLARADLFDRLRGAAPDLENVLNMLGGIFTDEIMTDLTYAIDVDNRPLETVAEEYLSSLGLIGQAAD